MTRKKKQPIDPSTRPELDLTVRFNTDEFLMYLIQDVTKLPTSDILGFFADLGKNVGDEGVHFMYENGTSSMRKEIFDFFPGTSVPFSLNVEGSKHSYYRQDNTPSDKRKGYYYIKVGFPRSSCSIDEVELSNIIMEKAILGACDMPNFEKPDPKCPKMYKDLMAEIRVKRMV